MIFLGILDLHTSLYTGFWTGIVDVTGNVFCHWPKTELVIGCLHAAAWKAQTTATVLLALNRCLESFNKYYAEILFNGKQIYFWMCLPILWGFQDIIWGPPIIFNPLLSILTYNPHEGYFVNDGNKVNIFLVENSYLICIIYYSIMIA